MNQYLIGIDGGASRSRAVLMDDRQNVVATAEGAGLNPLSVGWDAFGDHFEGLLEPLLKETSVEQVSGACAGLAGTGSEAIRRRAEKEIGSMFPFRRLVIITDALAALWGAFKGGPGLLLIAGTGSICLGMDEHGKTARSGGFGRLLGDEGSGYSIAMEAIREALHRRDVSRTGSTLAPAICAEYGLEDVLEIVPIVHSGELSPDRIAKLSERILTLSQQDAAARAIIQQASEHLAELVITTAHKLNLNQPELALWGGLWDSPGKEMQQHLKGALERHDFAVRILDPAEPPERGAVRYLQRTMV